MEKKLNKQEEKLQILIETKAFVDLTEVEQYFVLGQISQVDYELQHALVRECAELTEELQPLPLVISGNRRGIVIPLYQAIAAVAASIVISFLVFHSKESVNHSGEKIMLSQTDTVYVDRVELDTVVHYQIKYIDRNKKTVKAEMVKVEPDKDPMFISSEFQMSELSEMDLKNEGTSAINDKSIRLIRGIGL